MQTNEIVLQQTGPQDFRRFLQQELVNRCKRNPKYSLRSFAKALGIGSSALSDMLNQKRAITNKMIERLGLVLGLTPTDIRNFQVVADAPRRPHKSMMDFHQINLDTFAVISDWYHYAILELVDLNHFQADPRWISKILGITTTEARMATERLFKLGMLTVDAQDKWKNAVGNQTNVSEGLRASALRVLQKHVLEKALIALDEIPLELRDQSSMTMSIDSRQMPKAIDLLTEFRRRFCEIMQASQTRDSVYHLSLSFYPVTKPLKGKEK